jgi:predicted secreted Zn-dependent protease
MCKGPDGKKVFSDLPCAANEEKVEVRTRTGGPSINPGANVGTDHYDIFGTTWEELRGQIDAKGPEGFWGSAQTGVGYTLKARPGAQGLCVVDRDSIRATSEARMHLPNWRNRREGSAALQTQWDGVYRSLELHERGHVRINLDAVREIERTVMNIPAEPGCVTVELEAGRRAEAILNRLREQQRAYDKETDHGRSQWSPYR